MQVISLGAIHYAYIFSVFIILIALLLKKDIVLPCILGIIIIGITYSKNILTTLDILYNSIILSNIEFINIIVIISIMISLTRALEDINATYYMFKPLRKFFISPVVSFLLLGIITALLSWIIWPSPAIMIIATIVVPCAVNSGLPKIWCAIALSLFGYGISLSTDFFIQGAPYITAKAAGIDSNLIISASVPLIISFSIVMIITALILLKKDLKTYKPEKKPITEDKITENKLGKIFAYITIIVFVLDIIIMNVYNLTGSHATSLIGASSIILLVTILIFKDKKEATSTIIDYLKEGFSFGNTVFIPVIFIGAFFFLGSSEFASNVLGSETSILNDIGLYIASFTKVNTFSMLFMQMVVSFITGLDGSGFSGLSLVGSLSQTFSEMAPIRTEVIASFGQLTTIIVGGGTIIPWALASTAAVCEVDARNLAKKNLLPAVLGIIAMFITCLFII